MMSSNRGSSMSELNSLTTEEFVEVVGPVFEKSPWIAEAGAQRRPFADFDQLHQALCAEVRAADRGKQLALIRAHPDLVGNALLTPESQREQSNAGLLNLNGDEVARFQRLNQAYWNKFGFPFVICARLNKKEAILSAFPVRLEHSPEEEMSTALGEIEKIAYWRLRDIIQS